MQTSPASNAATDDTTVSTSTTSSSPTITTTNVPDVNDYDKVSNKLVDFFHNLIQKTPVATMVCALVALNVFLFHLDKICFDLILVCAFLFGYIQNIRAYIYILGVAYYYKKWSRNANMCVNVCQNCIKYTIYYQNTNMVMTYRISPLSKMLFFSNHYMQCL